MTDLQILKLLDEHYLEQREVVAAMYNVLWHWEFDKSPNNQGLWIALFGWCETRDSREQVWKRLIPHYSRAICLKEGRNHD